MSKENQDSSPNPENNHEQMDLFSTPEEQIEPSKDAALPAANMPEAVPTSGGGVSISLKDYYVGMQGMFKLGRRINTNQNFLVQTSNPGSPAYRMIERKFNERGQDLESKIGESQNTQQELQKAAKKHFAKRLLKKDELIEAGLIDEESVKKLGRAMFTEFSATYYGTANKTKLEKAETAASGRLKNARMNTDA